MKALALDTAVTCITIAAKNDDNTASLTLDIGMRQSEKLLPAIDYILSQVELSPRDLDYSVLTSGPGSFTGLRLGFAALKAIELSGNTPLYGINTLDYYAAPFTGFEGTVVSVIDAHKDKFYAKAFYNGKEIIQCDDWETAVFEDSVRTALAEIRPGEKNKILVCGLDAKIFMETCAAEKLFSSFNLFSPVQRVINFESLFALAEEKIAREEPPLKDYDGPEYFRGSEAELNQKK